MSAPFTTNEWERIPPFQPTADPRLDSASTNATTPTAQDPADATVAKQGANNSATAAGSPSAPAASGGPMNEVALIKASAGNAIKYVPAANVAAGGNRSAGHGALVIANQPAVHPGLYEDVDYHVRTLHAPPQPPSDLPPRVKRPARPPPVFANDINSAGERQHRAQREVSRMWRGVLCRRRLRQSRLLDEVLNNRARRIQCWWRSLQARWRRRQLHAIREQWAGECTARYIAERVQNTTNIIYWQQCRFDGAATLIQRWVRWHLRKKSRETCAVTGVPSAEWPPALPQPETKRHRPYFPWRRPSRTAGAIAAARATDKLANGGEDESSASGEAGPSRTLLQFREERAPVKAPTQTEVEAVNAAMRERNAQRAEALASPEAVSRAEWKAEGLRHEDLDFNAGVVQRVYRSKQAPIKVRTRQLTEEYFNKTARVIARTFRMYVLIRRMRHRHERLEEQVRTRLARRSAEKIEELKVEAVWQRELMDASATCIQRCWHWFRLRHFGILAPSYAAARREPTPPPYGLIETHIAREQELRWKEMNLLEQHEVEKQRHYTYFRFVPTTITVRKCVGRFDESYMAAAAATQGNSPAAGSSTSGSPAAMSSAQGFSGARSPATVSTPFKAPPKRGSIMFMDV